MRLRRFVADATFSSTLGIDGAVLVRLRISQHAMRAQSPSSPRAGMSRKLAMSTMTDARAFAEFDGDGDQKLCFEEFYAMQPNSVRDNFNANQLRTMFEVADTNKDGTLSVNEYAACV